MLDLRLRKPLSGLLLAASASPSHFWKDCILGLRQSQTRHLRHAGSLGPGTFPLRPLF
jgi:hypothetical protein